MAISPFDVPAMFADATRVGNKRAAYYGNVGFWAGISID
jgi:hypothetical protein